MVDPLEAAVEESSRLARETRRCREDRACKTCGWVRKVLVRYWPRPDGTIEVSWSKVCTACDLLQAAELDSKRAIQKRKRAAAIVAARGKRRGSVL